VVQCLTPALGSSDSYAQVILNPGLPDEAIKAPWAEASIKWYILNAGFA